MTVNLKGMSRKDLLKLQKDLEKALRDAMSREKDEARKAAEKVAAEFGFSLAEVTDGMKPGRKGSGTVSPPRYKNPANPEQTWTGKGRKPGWMNDALAKGIPVSDMEL